MKKIINGKRYDTDTAKAVGEAGYSHRGDFSYWAETLYRKNTGEYFLYGAGGPMSRYAVTTGQNEWSGGEKIIPLNLENAKAWAEEYLDGDEYEKLFGAVEETGNKKAVTIMLSESAITAAKNASVAAGVSMSEYIESLIRNAT